MKPKQHPDTRILADGTIERWTPPTHYQLPDWRIVPVDEFKKRIEKQRKRKKV